MILDIEQPRFLDGEVSHLRQRRIGIRIIQESHGQEPGKLFDARHCMSKSVLCAKRRAGSKHEHSGTLFERIAEEGLGIPRHLLLSSRVFPFSRASTGTPRSSDH